MVKLNIKYSEKFDYNNIKSQLNSIELETLKMVYDHFPEIFLHWMKISDEEYRRLDHLKSLYLIKQYGQNYYITDLGYMYLINEGYAKLVLTSLKHILKQKLIHWETKNFESLVSNTHTKENIIRQLNWVRVCHFSKFDIMNNRSQVN
ncbi:MAG: hypothetical protein HeimC2_45680 [Candidatus Heimdallarchaeota archaeon LC_2]|nr:MAG: hypothetical protein HeimC2_45680 [Candidatus Heimdallarchaeota archaeon LC_2]